MLWFEHGMEWWRRLDQTMGWNGEDGWIKPWVGMVETVEFHWVMWIVMLESAKDRILGVDNPG
jgi:hypothetical protein